MSQEKSPRRSKEKITRNEKRQPKYHKSAKSYRRRKNNFYTFNSENEKCEHYQKKYKKSPRSLRKMKNKYL